MMNRPPKRYAGEQPLDTDQMQRRGSIVRVASTHLSTSEEAVAFLNTFHDELGGRPLDIATGSAAGFSAVEEALKRKIAPATASVS